MINTPLMSDLIQKGEVHEMKELIAKSVDQGMQTFDQALFNLIEEHAITIEEARHFTRNSGVRLPGETCAHSVGEFIEGQVRSISKDLSKGSFKK